MGLQKSLLLPSVVSIGIALSAIGQVAAAEPATPAAESVTAEAEAADAKLRQVMKETQAQWTAETVQALLQLGTLDEIAMAAHINRLTDDAALARCAEDDSCDQHAGSPGLKEPTHGLAIEALAQADRLSVDLLRTLLSQHLRYLDAERQDQLVALLIERTPGDVYSWLLKLHVMIERKASADELTRVLNQAAATAREANEWFLVYARRVDAAYALVPPPPAMLAAARELNASKTTAEVPLNADDIRRVFAFGVAMAVATPGFNSLALCRMDESFDPARRPACTSLAKTLATDSQSLLDRGIGLAYWHRLVEGTPQEATVIALKRQHYWQSEFHLRRFTEPYDLQADLSYGAKALEQGDSNELELLESALREAGVSAEPPPQWLPRNPDVLLARH